MTVRTEKPAINLREELNALRGQVGRLTEVTAEFTPVLADASTGGNESATVLKGQYTKHGSIVHMQISGVDISTVGMTGANDMFITGIPFTAYDRYAGAVFQPYAGSVELGFFTIVSGFITPYINPGENWIKFVESQTGAALDPVTVSQITTGTADFSMNLTFQTNE